VEGGQILYKEDDASTPVNLLAYDRYGREMRAIRGSRISMIFQEPMTSLHPCYTIGDQITEAVRLHTSGKAEVKDQVLAVLKNVEMPNPERIYHSFPHQMSGGMRQRAMIAMALSCQPRLLIADEPTTALDVTTEAQILDLMRQLQAELGMSFLYITHNMGVIAQMADRVAVMYLGKVVEEADIKDIFYNPKHPYTISLLRSIPRLGQAHRERLESIKGAIPDPYTRLSGCPFHPRCPSIIAGVCEQQAPILANIPGDHEHQVRCHHYLAG
jgi:peptide/nickel transport system ATP-binding protein